MPLSTLRWESVNYKLLSKPLCERDFSPAISLSTFLWVIVFDFPFTHSRWRLEIFNALGIDYRKCSGGGRLKSVLFGGSAEVLS